MEEKLQKLYDYIEDRCANGVYRSSFFDLAGESLRETKGQPRQIRRAKALENVLGKMELVVQPYELIGGTIAGIYPRVEVPTYEQSKEEGRKTVLEYVKNRDVNKEEKWQRQALYGRILYHGRIQFQDMQRIIDELTAELGAEYGLSRAEIGYLMEKLFTWDFGENGKLVGELPWEATNHNDLNPPKFLGRGLNSIREEIIERQKDCSPEQVEILRSDAYCHRSCDRLYSPLWRCLCGCRRSGAGCRTKGRTFAHCRCMPQNLCPKTGDVF